MLGQKSVVHIALLSSLDFKFYFRLTVDSAYAASVYTILWPKLGVGSVVRVSIRNTGDTSIYQSFSSAILTKPKT